MFKALILFTIFIGLSYGQYLRINHPPSNQWGASGAYSHGNAWAQPGSAARYTGTPYGGAWRGAARPAYTGAYYGPSNQGGYVGGYRGGYGAAGAYVAPLPARVGVAPVGPSPLAPVGVAPVGVAHVGVAPAVTHGVPPVRVGQPYYGGRYEDESYKPYSFGFDTVDEYGTQLGRQETADGSGNVRGSYSYRDPTGQFRQVQYAADHAGFRAEVNTNEAGVISHRPADAVYNVHHK